MQGIRDKAGVAVAVAALVVGAAACSGSDNDNDSRAAKSTASKPADRAPAMEPAAAVRKAATSSEKLTSFSYRMKGTLPGQGAIGGEAAMSLDPLAVRMKMTGTDQGESGSGEIRIVGGAMYIYGGEEAAEEMDGKSWMKLPMGDKGAAAGGGGMAQQADRNPAAESQFLTGSKDLRTVGAETVDGVRTTHYTGTVALDDLATGKGGDARSRKATEEGLKAYRDMGISKVTMDIWIDESQHAKQFRSRGAGKEGPMDVTVTFLDIDKPVVVTVPPAAKTFDFAKELQDAAAQ